MKIPWVTLLLRIGYPSIGSGVAKGIVYLLIAAVLAMVLLVIRPRPKREKPRVFLARAPKREGQGGKRLGK
ncbi:MAG: hypothetical protein QXP65_04385 [Candidatus Hadarchaeales archaeon]